MSVIDTTTEVPVLAAPSRPEGRMSLRQFLRVVRENILATYAPEDFDKDFIARRLLWRRTFVVNEPNGVRHVLLDNAQNYKKSELSRRILEPGLGRGLITTDGELWRRHRRIMAPAFDPRSVAGYAPVMTEVTEEMLAQWDALPERSEVDVAVAMMHTTLHIISRAMFSSDSDEIVDVVERGVSEYQTTVRPNLLDLLHFPEWLTELISPRMADGILDEFDASVDRLLTERGRAPDAEPKDLLARLIAARDTETGGGMTAQEVRDQVVTIFMAGHETTAQALAWTWYLLSQHPGAEAKLLRNWRGCSKGARRATRTSPTSRTRAWCSRRRCGSIRRRTLSDASPLRLTRCRATASRLARRC
jgi:cytochrome P450